jgi:hypothetical protein
MFSYRPAELKTKMGQLRVGNLRGAAQIKKNKMNKEK